MTRSSEELLALAEHLGPAQRRTILALGEEWGPAPCYQTAKRVWHGVTGRGIRRASGPLYVIEHKHRTNNCWRLNDYGVRVQAALRSLATKDSADGVAK